jgi:hypothetical protein
MCLGPVSTSTSGEEWGMCLGPIAIPLCTSTSGVFWDKSLGPMAIPVCTSTRDWVWSLYDALVCTSTVLLYMCLQS